MYRPVPIEIENIASDVKAEVIGAALVESGVNIDEIVINPIGISKRSVRKDVIDIHRKDGGADDGEYLFLDVSREGLYDSLPQGLFHQSKIVKTKRTTEDIIDEMKLFKVQEEFSRLFFLALEKEFNRVKLNEELEERKSIFGFSEHYKFELYLKIWPELKNIGQKYLVLLFQLLPVSYKVVGDNDLISNIIGAFCLKPVEIRIVHEKKINQAPEIKNELGKPLVGTNFILGNQFIDFDPCIELCVKEIKRDELNLFLPGGKLRKVIDLLIEYFFPISVDVQIILHLQKEEEGLYLSFENEISYLGYN